MVKKEDKGLMRILQIVKYKEGNILIRRFPKNMYVWDVFYKGQFYSSYLIIKPIKGKKELTEEELSEVTKMCYAGAASTIDYQMGEKLSKSEKEVVKQFEGARKQEGEA